jgi:LemA protein
MTLPILIGIVVVLALIAIVVPIKFMNMFVQLDKVCEESWSGIDIVLRRRYDLIPNLVSSVKGYMDHERTVLEQISKLRELGVQSRSVGQSMDVEKQLAPALANLFARAEAYPELKASAAFTELQRELVDTEDRVAAARRIYNNNVREFNTAIAMFPGSVFAGGRKDKPYFEIDDPVARRPVTVSFSS